MHRCKRWGNSMGNPRRLWGHPDAEIIAADNADEAIQEILEQTTPPPETVTVAQFKPMAFTLRYGTILEWCVEDLHEDYQYEGCEWEPTERVKSAEAMLVAALHADYRVTNLEPTGVKMTVNTVLWMQKNAPDLLKEMRE